MFINDLFNDKNKTLNEVSNELLGRYKKAAGADASAADKRGDIERGNKRFRGIVKATVKQGENDVKRHKAQSVAEGKEDKVKQLKQDYATAVHWSKNDTNPHKREAARQKAEKIKRHLETQYKQGVAEGSELKQAKRKYNQAAKDANLDQVGAGKKIDTMKKSLRQKDLGKEQGMAEGRFQDEHPEYGGKDPNKTMTYDRNIGIGYAGEPWSDATDNWSGEEGPKLSPNTKQTITLKDRLTGKEADYDIDSPEAQEIFANQKQQTANSPVGKAVIKAFSTPVDRSKIKTVGQSDSTSDFSDSELGNEIIPSTSVQAAKPVSTSADIDAGDGKTMRWDAAKARMVPVEEPKKADENPPEAEKKAAPKFDQNSKFVLWDPVKQRPVTQADQKGSAKEKDSSSIPVKPRPGSWQELARLNNITDPTKLKYGTFIKTPNGDEVYVNKGDTLSKIARKLRGNAATKVKEDVSESYAHGFADPKAPRLGGRRQNDEPDAVNNIEVSINGRPWKVFAGKGSDSSPEFFRQKQAMDSMCKRKTLETGKEWSWGVTGAAATNEGKCNMTEQGRSCPKHGIMECPGYSRLIGEAFKMPPESLQDKMHRKHQELRKKSGLPDPSHYKELAKKKQQEIDALRAEIAADKDKGLTEERYLEELQRAGYDVITEKKIRQRLDPKCWKGKHKEGTKIKGGVRVNNCVPNK